MVDVIRVDGARIRRRAGASTWPSTSRAALVSTMDDPQGRTTITDYLGRRSKEGLFHVGRLDTPAEGLLLVTNDGDFAQRMMHPSHEISKTYVAEIEGVIENVTLRKLSRGIKLDDGPVRADQVKLINAAAPAASSRWCCTRA